MSIDDEVRRLVIDSEAAARRSSRSANARAALLPQYELYLKVLSKDRGDPVRRAEDYVRVVAAMRDSNLYADLALAVQEDETEPERLILSPLRVIASYLARVPDTCVFVVERGAGVLTFFLLRGGTDALAERIVLARAGNSCVAALTDLMYRQRGDIDKIGSGAPVSQAFFQPIKHLSRRLWSTIPEEIRDGLNSARTVLFLPSTFGDLAEFPLELLCTDEGWLGARSAVSRLGSIRTLLEMMSPNRMPSSLPGGALLARAADTNELPNVDAELAAVEKALKARGIEARIDPGPDRATMTSALDEGFKLIHFCGHGFAGPLGEALPLAEGDILAPTDFSQLEGWATPLVYLSTCETGRSRMTTTGNASGFAVRLIEKGAPGVVGCLQSVPDLVARLVAQEFYRAFADQPLAAALSAARANLEVSLPPACWGAFGCFGDPNLQFPSSGPQTQTRDDTLRWDSLVARHAALATEKWRKAAIVAVTGAQDENLPVAEIVDWLENSFAPGATNLREERLVLCNKIAAVDPVYGASVRLLLAMEVLEGCYCGPRLADIVCEPGELTLGLYCARGIHDVLAWSAFAAKATDPSGADLSPTETERLLEEAEGALRGWRQEEPEVEALLVTVQQGRQELRTSQ